MRGRETHTQASSGRQRPAGRQNAVPTPALARAMGNARMARLARTGPPAEGMRGASPETAMLMRAASLSTSPGARLDRCGPGCGCATCADEELEEDGLKPT
jgi:hypothetical protein